MLKRIRTQIVGLEIVPAIATESPNAIPVGHQALQ